MTLYTYYVTICKNKYERNEKMNYYEIIHTVVNICLTAISFLLAYKVLYVIIGFFNTRKFEATDKRYRYGIVIAARNEEAVIGNLLESINKQDYEKEKITVFVVADNCSDNTAEIARNHGAVCYERFDDLHRTKGYALKYLFERIEEDYKTQSFDGFFVFDADNLLEKDYISRMNEAFASGEKIITSYRNTKNLSDGWIAASYAFHWLRCCRTNHRPRALLKLATNLQGTGFLFASELVKMGWKYTSFTEDRAFSADAVRMGYKISYNEAARFYDEQPTDLKIALRQRLRWSKGHLMAFCESSLGLFTGIFKQKRFACYDMLCQITPFPVIKFFLKLFLFLSGIFYYSSLNGATLSKTVLKIFNLSFTPSNAVTVILTLLLFSVIDFITKYLADMFTAIYVLIFERKHLERLSIFKKIWYVIMWPWFNIIGRFTLLAALFMKVEWKPIPHKSNKKIEQIKNNN